MSTEWEDPSAKDPEYNLKTNTASRCDSFTSQLAIISLCVDHTFEAGFHSCVHEEAHQVQDSEGRRHSSCVDHGLAVHVCQHVHGSELQQSPRHNLSS